MWEEREYSVYSEYGTYYGTYPTESQAENRIVELEEDEYWEGEPPMFFIQ